MHTTVFKIIALSGSLRRGSTNTALIEAARRVAPAGIEVTLYDGIGALPLFTPDLEQDLPGPARHLRAALCAADAILIACPEYAHGVPGAFKNALDWVVGCAELGAKPVALLNAAPRAVHAQAALAEIVVTMNLHLVTPAALPIAVTRGMDADAIAGEAHLASRLRGALSTLACSAQGRVSG